MPVFFKKFKAQGEAEVKIKVADAEAKAIKIVTETVKQQKYTRASR